MFSLLVIIVAGVYLRFMDPSMNIRDAQYQTGSVVAVSNSGSMTIDFSTCEKGGASVPFGLGSTSFVFSGINKGACNFHMGTEIEDPNWDGTLDTVCKVPPSEGIREFTVGSSGIDFDGLVEKYCS